MNGIPRANNSRNISNIVPGRANANHNNKKNKRIERRLANLEQTVERQQEFAAYSRQSIGFLESFRGHFGDDYVANIEKRLAELESRTFGVESKTSGGIMRTFGGQAQKAAVRARNSAMATARRTRNMAIKFERGARNKTAGALNAAATRIRRRNNLSNRSTFSGPTNNQSSTR